MLGFTVRRGLRFLMLFACLLVGGNVLAGFPSGAPYLLSLPSAALDDVRLYQRTLTPAEIAGLTPQLKRRYTYGHDLISQTDVGTSTTHYYGYDGHGSVRMLLSSASGASTQITDTYDYDAYGQLLAKTGTTVNHYRYTGEQWDNDLGMYYLRARYLNPNTGRFWTMDSYEGNNRDPLTLHKYLYAHANPVNNIDPSGHWSLGSTLSTMTIGTAIGMWSSIAANHALGRAQTYSSIFIGGAFGAAMGPLAVAIPEIGVGLGIYGIGASGSITYEVFSNPDATASQRAAAVSLVVASIWGTKVAIKHARATRAAPPAENVPAPAVPEFPLPLRAPPEIVLESAQPGLSAGKVGQLPGLIESMAAGKPIPYIAGWRIGNRYIINEGNHRMTAALELYKTSGDPKHVLQLLKEGNWVNKDPGISTWKLTQD